MKESVASENIIKLRELTDKLTRNKNSDEYKLIVKKLKEIVENGKGEIEDSKTPQSKIKCYETMCLTITNLLTSVTFK